MNVTLTTYTDLLTRSGRVMTDEVIRPGCDVWALIGLVQEADPGRIAAGPWSVLVNGKPVTGPYALDDHDSVVVAPRPGTVIDAVLLAVAIASAAASAAMISRAKLPAASGSETPEQQRFGFGHIAHEAFAGETIPVVVGYRPREGGSIIAVVPARSSDGSGDDKIKMLICLGHGPLAMIGDQEGDFNNLTSQQIDDIWFGDQPAGNFPGVRMWGRMGTANQAVIPGFRDTEILREVGVGGSILRNTSGSERTGSDPSGEAVTFTGVSSVNAVILNVRLPRGLYTLTGQVEPRTVKYRYRTRESLGPGAWSAWTVVALTQARQSAFYSAPRADNLASPPEIRDVQVERVSVETGDPAHLDELLFESVVEVTYGNNRYPKMALLALEITASDQLTGVPDVAATVRGLGNLRIWDGVSPASAPEFDSGYSANPADIALEILTNTTWGLGLDDDQIDFASLFEWRTRCDEEVELAGGAGTRPRFAFNWTLREERDAMEWLITVCRAGWCTPIVAGDVMRFAFDRPQAVTAETFGDGSLRVDDEGNSDLTIDVEMGTRGLVRPNQFIAQIENELEHGENDAIVFPADGEEWLAQEQARAERIRLEGVTHPEQAWAHLVYLAKRARLQTRSVSFTTSRPFVVVQPWDLFKLSAGLMGWGESGRLVSGSTDQMLLLDRTVTIAGSDTIKIIHVDDTIEIVTVVASPGVYPPGTPIAVETMAQSPHEFAEWALGGALPDSKPFLCTEVSLEDAHRMVWRIGGIEYVEDVYDPDPANLNLPPYSNLRTGRTPPGPVIELVGFERLVNSLHVVELAWSQRPEDAQITGSFLIYRRVLGAIAWVRVPALAVSLRSAVIEIDELDKAYQFVVVAVSHGGAHLPPTDPGHPIFQLVLGLSAPPPPPPENVLLVQETGNRYTLSWDAVEDASEYQVLFGGTASSRPNDGAEDCLIMARTPETSITGLVLAPGRSHRFYVRSAGANGRLSWSANDESIASPGPPAGESVKHTEIFDLSAVGTLENLTYSGGALRLVSALSPGVWTSPEIDTGSLSLTEITARIGTLNDAADPVLSSDPFVVPSIAADQWGVVSTGPKVVGMLMPPWPDDEQDWSIEVRTRDGSVWSDWEALAPMTRVRRMLDLVQIRVTMTRAHAPYRPAMASLAMVATH